MKKLLITLMVILASVPCFADNIFVTKDGHRTYMDEHFFFVLPEELKLHKNMPIKEDDEEIIIYFVNNDFSDDLGNYKILASLSLREVKSETDFNKMSLDTYDWRMFLYEIAIDRDTSYIETKKIAGDTYTYTSSYEEDGSFRVFASHSNGEQLVNLGAVLMDGWNAEYLNAIEDLLSSLKLT